MNLQCIRFLIVISYVFTLPFVTKAGETMGSGLFQKNDYTNIPISNDVKMISESCPKNIKKWVEEDFNDISTLGVLNYKSEAPSCTVVIKKYEDFIQNFKKTDPQQEFIHSLKQNNDKKTSVQQSSNKQYSEYLSQRFKSKINPIYKDRLVQCSSLGPVKEKIAQTRFYAASSKIEAVNSSLVDEISYIDSIVMPGSILKDIECTKIFPEIDKKCESYKKTANSCKLTPEDRQKNLVIKTKKNIEKVKLLKKAFEACQSTVLKKSGPTAMLKGASVELKNKINNSCGSILEVIARTQAETPWVNGEKFNSIAVKSKAHYQSRQFVDTQYNNDDKIKEAIVEQLKDNRKAYTEQYKSNLQNMMCLTYNNKTDGQDCDYKVIRKEISELPDLTLNPKNMTAAENQMTNYLKAESCLLDKGEKRQNEKERDIAIAEGVGTVAVSLAVPGLGLAYNAAIASARGARTLSFIGQSLSKASRARNAMIGLESMNIGLSTGLGLKNTIQSCSQRLASEKKMSTSVDNISAISKQNICDDPESRENQAIEEENNCIMNALLSTADTLPFIAGVAGLPALLKLKNINALEASSQKKLSDFYKNGDRTEINKILAKNGQLNPEQRIKAAEEMVGRKLSQRQSDCVLNAHNIASNKVMRVTSQSVGETYSTSDLLAKRTVLTECGFSSQEVSFLMRSGITGNHVLPSKLSLRQQADKLYQEATSADQSSTMILKYKQLSDTELQTGSYQALGVMGHDRALMYSDHFRHLMLGNDLDSLTNDILTATIQISKGQKGASERTGKSVTALIEDESQNMKKNAEDLIRRATDHNQAKTDESSRYEAWQLMRTRVELIKKQSIVQENHVSAEELREIDKRYYQAEKELQDFIEKNNLKKSVSDWSKYAPGL